MDRVTNVEIEVEKYDLDNTSLDHPIASIRAEPEPGRTESDIELFIWDNKRLAQADDPVPWTEEDGPRFDCSFDFEQVMDAKACRVMAAALLKAAETLEDLETEAVIESFN